MISPDNVNAFSIAGCVCQTTVALAARLLDQPQCSQLEALACMFRSATESGMRMRKLFKIEGQGTLLIVFLECPTCQLKTRWCRQVERLQEPTHAEVQTL